MRYLVTIIFILSAKLSFTQVKIKNTDLVNDDSAIIFRNVVNHFEIAGKISEMNTLSIKGAQLSRKGPYRFIVRNIFDDSVKIEVGIMVNNKKKVLCSKIFHSVEIGEPSVELDEKEDETFPNGQVLNRTSLEVKMSNPNYAGNWEVAHFEISLIDPSGNSIIMPPAFISGKYLGKTIYDKINALPVGSKIAFTQVVLMYPDGGFSKYKDFSLRKK